MIRGTGVDHRTRIQQVACPGFRCRRDDCLGYVPAEVRAGTQFLCARFGNLRFGLGSSGGHGQAESEKSSIYSTYNLSEQIQ